MRPFAIALLATAAFSSPALADTELEAQTLDIYKTAIEIPTVKGRGEVPKLANYSENGVRVDF